MRKLYAAIVLFFLPVASLFAQVATTPMPMGSLVEDFTGINCPNCPDAHVVIGKLGLLHPGLIHAVCIHAGHYAEAYGDLPNFITDESTTIHNAFSISSYPSGMVNRYDYGKGLVAGRSDWFAYTAAAARTTAAVNLGVSANYDAATRQLTVSVEGYGVEAVEEASLSVYLTESDIIGYQAGSGVGEDYHHLHVFRKSLSDVWGDPLGSVAQGRRFEKQYIYNVPEKINNTAVCPANLQVVAFVTALPQTDVVGVAEATPTGVSHPLRVRMYQGLLPIEKTYGFNFVEAYLQNASDEEVTTATFDVTLNGVKHNATWTGTLAPHSTQLIHIPATADWQEAQRNEEGNTYKVAFVSANNVEQEGEFKFSGKFNELPEYPTEMTFKLRTDEHAADNTFRILDGDGNVVKAFGPYAEGTVGNYEEAFTLEGGKVYCFKVMDWAGDGIYSPRGQVQLCKADGSLVTQNKEIKNCGYRQFFRTKDASGIHSLTTDDAPASYYDLQGRQRNGATKGLLIKKQGRKISKSFNF